MNKDNTLMQFVRDRRGQPRGIVVATVIDNSIRMGWSYTNTKAGDRFNKQRGLQIALGRADTGVGMRVKIPHNVEKVLEKMARRADAFYKNAVATTE